MTSTLAAAEEIVNLWKKRGWPPEEETAVPDIAAIIDRHLAPVVEAVELYRLRDDLEEIVRLTEGRGEWRLDAWNELWTCIFVIEHVLKR